MAGVGGKRHALRIWVQPNGAGKACILDGGGATLNPKKSARRTKDQATGGLAVLWGSLSAEWAILCEGVETAAAVAMAFGEEVEAGKVLIAAAGSAGGVEAFKPWPSCRRVTCAADRDELSKNGRAPSRRGESAARNFSARNESLEVSVALAGTQGTSKDWLEMFVENNAETVREGILAAVPCTPTEARENRPAISATNSDEVTRLAETRRLYPVPRSDSVALEYALTRHKRVRLHKRVTSRDGDAQLIPIASPISIPARLRYLDRDDAYGVRVEIEGFDGLPVTVDLRRDLLAARNGDVMSKLFEAGLRVEADGEKFVLAALKAADPEKEIHVVRNAGWNAGPDGAVPFFACSDGEIIRRQNAAEIELDAACRTASTRAGTLEQWKEAVSASLAVDDCPHWLLGIVAGCAGVIVGLTQLDTCGFNLSGKTSAGKTTAQMLAASCWSRPILGGDGHLQSARATINALEYIAARANGTVLALDELAHVPAGELGKLVYSLAGGVGKGRLTSEAKFRSPPKWRSFVVLSSERSIAEIIQSDGGRISPGMTVRIVDIDVTGVNRSVSRDIMDCIEGVKGAYGHAGPEFVRRLVATGTLDEPDALRRRILEISNVMAGDQADSSLRRAATPFAILFATGELMKAFDILPKTTDVNKAVLWAWKNFRSSRECETLDTDTDVISSVQDWVIRHWGSSIHDAKDSKNSKESMAWFDADNVYIPRHNLAAAAGGIMKEKEVASVLVRAGAITKTKASDCRFVSYVPGIGATKAYALARKIFGREKHVPNADIPF
jgi:hypothetical protein